MISPPLAGIFTGATSDAFALVLGCTGLLGGAARYAAVLANRDDRAVDRATASGFFFGMVIGVFMLVIDLAT